MDKISKKINIAVIGLGFGAQIHIPVFKSIPGCEVAAICSSNEEELMRVSSQFGIERSFSDWEHLLESDNIHAVSIATPPAVQTDIALMALKNNKAVLCEKPLSFDLSSAETMAASAQRSGLANMIDFEFPEIDQWQEAKNIIDNGSIGRINHCSVSWNVLSYANKMDIDSWKTRSDEGGGVLNLFTSHVFYYLESLLGPMSEVSAILSKAPWDKKSADTFNSISTLFDSGATGNISISNDAFRGNGHNLTIFGEKGTLVIDNTTSDYACGYNLFLGNIKNQKFELLSSNEDLKDSAEDSRLVPVGKLIGRFVEWIRTGKKTAPDFSDGARIQRILDACRKSNLSGTRINIE